MTIIYAVAIGLSVGAAATVARRIGEGDPDGAARAAVQSIIIGLARRRRRRRHRHPLRAAAAPADGRRRQASSSTGIAVRARDDRRERRRHAAVPHQRRLSRRRRRRHRDARAVDRQRHQHHARAVPDLRPRPVPATRRHGRGHRHEHRPLDRRADSDLLPHAQGRPPQDPVAARQARSRRSCGGSSRISGSATFQNFIGTASYMGAGAHHQRLRQRRASPATPSASAIILFALLPSWGVSNAAVTLVGQNLGAGKPDRAEESAWKIWLYNTVCLVSIGVIFLLFAPAHRQRVHQRCRRRARTRSTACGSSRSGFLFYGYGMVLTAAFNGAGDTRTPTLINLVSLWLLGDSAGLGAGLPARLRTDRRVHRAERRLLDDVLSERVDFPAGTSGKRRGSDLNEPRRRCLSALTS